MVISLNPSKNPGSGKITPALHMIGSRITAAIWSLFLLNSPSTLLRSLNLAIRVSAVKLSGTPGVPGRAKVSTPEPAFANR